MSETLKIKLSIADRVYPLNIPLEQEEGLRKAAKDINEMIKQFEQSYAVRDKQDVLAMCALQFASRASQKNIEDTSGQQEAMMRIKALSDLLDGQL